MSAIFKWKDGDPTPRLVDIQVRKTETGWSSVYCYEGDEQGIKGYANFLSPTLDQFNLHADGPVWRMEVSYAVAPEFSGSIEQPVDTWELLGNDVEKSAYQNESFLTLTTAQIAEVKSWYEKVSSQSDPSATFQAPSFEQNSTAVQQMQSRLYRHLIFGFDSFAIGQFVFKRTRRMSSRSSVHAAFTNIHKLHTTAQVKATESPPSTLLFSLDEVDATQTALSGSTDVFDPNGSGRAMFLWSWLKRAPTVSQIGGPNRFAVTYEYWFGAWSNVLYSTAT